MDMMMNHTMPMMEMYFHFSNNIRHVLFETWTVDTDAELFGAMVFSFFLAVLYEGLKTLKDLLAKKMNTFASVPIASINSESNLRTFIPYRRLKLWTMRVVVSLLRTVEIGMAYILMLLAMTYNVWIFLSVCFGAGAGFLIFLPVRPHLSSDDHCG